MAIPLLTAGFVAYVLASRAALRLLRGVFREAVMASLNLAGVFGFLFYGHGVNGAPRFVIYVFLVSFYYLFFYLFSGAKGWLHWLAFFSPIGGLVLVRYVPINFYQALGVARGHHFTGPLSLIGLSYLAFRCSRLALEVRNESVARPGFWQYFTFAFFLPTMPVGPINTYANFRRGFETPGVDFPLGRSAVRVMVGLIKYEFLGGVLSRLGYSHFLLNSHLHDRIDLPVVMIFYYLFLYCNFSGCCDIAIGTAGLIGLPVPENFNNPFVARNIKDFWNRWHITLSQWMRDIVFSPLSKFLVRLMGPANANHAIALAIIVVFLLVGIWHGVGWNYALFGLIHALGLVTSHYYTIGLKQWLGREGFKAYNENCWIHAAAVALTFAYCAASFLFFANTLPQIKEIFEALR